MADYTLTAGFGTAVRETMGPDQGYVDLAVNALAALTALATGDEIILYDASEGGANKHMRVTLANLQAFLRTYQVIWREAGAFDYPDPSLPAGMDRETGTNQTRLRHRFDDTLLEKVGFSDRISPYLKTTGTVIIIAVGYAHTPVAAKNVQLRFSHRAIADGETWDVAFSTEDSGDKVPAATARFTNIWTWTQTVGNLGWAAGDWLDAMLGRIAPVGATLVGDWCMTGCGLLVPRT